MADTRHISNEITEIAAELIETEPELEYIREAGVSIVYLESTAAKKSGGKAVLGQCEKIAEKYKWGIPADFTITIFEPNVSQLSEEQLRVLVFHELLHVGITDEGGLYVRPHDLEDFKAIVDRYGTRWAEEPLPFER